MHPGLHAFWGRAKSLLQRRRLDREMAEELEFHQALLREKLLREGSNPADADHATRQAFGNARRWHERMREVRQFRRLENLLRDVRFSARLLRKAPGFTFIAVLTLGLGAGANTAVFSLINGLLLRPLPVPNADRLAVLSFSGDEPQAEYSFCTPFFRSLESRRDLFANVFAFNPETMQVRGRNGNENIHGMLVSGQFFDALETPPLLGRYLTSEDDKLGGSPTGLAVVISERFWERWFDRAPNVVGRKLVIANAPFTVVGVMPKRFIGADPTQRAELYVPLSADPVVDAPQNHSDAGMHAWWLRVMAKLPPGVSLEQANATLRTMSGPILRETTSDPAYLADAEKHHFHFATEVGSRGFAYVRIAFRKPLATMFAMCGGILLLACLNLASLLMARSSSRERELATRLALGATRSRLIQQLLIESLLLAIAGTVLGLAAAPLASHALAAMLMSSTASQSMTLDTSTDLRVLAFAIAISAVAALVIGVVPALQATDGRLNEHMKQGRHATKAHERRLLPRVLMSAEVALALVLVSGAGLLTVSLVKLYRSGAGFDPKGLVNIAFSMDKQPLDGERLLALYRQIGEGLRQQPGVKDVSFQFIVPLLHRGWNGYYSAPGDSPHILWMNSVAPEYFRTMRIPVKTGREFLWSDTKGSGPKMILNESAARMLFPDGDALGRQVVDTINKTTFEVVAVVGDAKYRDMRAPAPAAAYVSMMQNTEEKKPSLSAVVRVDGPLAPVASAARSLATRLAPSIPAPVLTTYDEMVDDSLGAERMMAVLAMFFAGCALLVTGIGLYGTLAYATSRRTSEIGIRMALGAQRVQVMAMIFRQNVLLAVVGSVAGLIAALLASRALTSFLYETSPRDPWILLGSIAALSAIASAASLLPALKAARIEPMAAIRCE